MFSYRKMYDGELRELSSGLVRMNGRAAAAVEEAMCALKECDPARAQAVMDGDEEIDNMERLLEQRCLKLLLLQQPMAADLRQVSAALKMITDIERIGDEAVDIAELAARHTNCSIPELREGVLHMAEEAEAMINAASSCYLSDNLSLAIETQKQDDVVDEWFVRLRGEMGRHLVEHPEAMDEVIDYLMIIKYLERVGDHAVNLCEWVEFKITGKHKKAPIFD